jgi:hypothetical protein
MVRFFGSHFPLPSPPCSIRKGNTQSPSLITAYFLESNQACFIFLYSLVCRRHWDATQATRDAPQLHPPALCTGSIFQRRQKLMASPRRLRTRRSGDGCGLRSSRGAVGGTFQGSVRAAWRGMKITSIVMVFRIGRIEAEAARTRTFPNMSAARVRARARHLRLSHAGK